MQPYKLQKLLPCKLQQLLPMDFELVVAIFNAHGFADEWLADSRERREGRCKGVVYNEDLMVWMGHLIASDGDWVTKLRDSVMNVARGETPYPPCSDIEGVRAHYETLFEDSMCMALIAYSAARGGYEIKGKGKGKGKGGKGKDAEGDNDAAADDAPDDALAWLQKLLTMLQQAGWPADVFGKGKGWCPCRNRAPARAGAGTGKGKGKSSSSGSGTGKGKGKEKGKGSAAAWIRALVGESSSDDDEANDDEDSERQEHGGGDDEDNEHQEELTEFLGSKGKGNGKGKK